MELKWRASSDRSGQKTGSLAVLVREAYVLDVASVATE